MTSERDALRTYKTFIVLGAAHIYSQVYNSIILYAQFNLFVTPFLENVQNDPNAPFFLLYSASLKIMDKLLRAPTNLRSVRVYTL